MKNEEKVGHPYYSGCSHIFFMKPFALVRGTLQKTSGILFITNFSFSGTRIVAPDKQAYIRYPKNKNAFQVCKVSKTQKIN